MKLVKTFALCSIFTASLVMANENTDKCGNLTELGMFMLDYSGSMMVKEDPFTFGKNKIEKAHSLIKQLASETDSDINFTVLSFATQTVQILPLKDKSDFIDEIDSLPSKLEIFGRKTNLGDGFSDLLKRMNNPDSNPKLLESLKKNNTLFILTDGQESNYGISLEEGWSKLSSSTDINPVVISFALTDEEKISVNTLSNVIKAPIYDGMSLLNDKNARMDFIQTYIYKPCSKFDLTLSNDSLFAFDRSELKEKGKQKLAQFAALIADNKEYLQKNEVKFSISAFTDRLGSDSYNEALSQRRLDSVLRELNKLKVDPNLFIKRQALGERYPITGTKCDKLSGNTLINCLQPDRRVEIREIRRK